MPVLPVCALKLLIFKGGALLKPGDIRLEMNLADYGKFKYRPSGAARAFDIDAMRAGVELIGLGHRVFLQITFFRQFSTGVCKTAAPWEGTQQT
jgi:hypothetical protein